MPSGVSDFVNRDDIRMIERGNRRALRAQTLDAFVVRSIFGGQNFQRDFAVELCRREPDKLRPFRPRRSVFRFCKCRIVCRSEKICCQATVLLVGEIFRRRRPSPNFPEICRASPCALEQAQNFRFKSSSPPHFSDKNRFALGFGKFQNGVEKLVYLSPTIGFIKIFSHECTRISAN